MEELEDIWNAAPKFPDVAGVETRIDVDSFVQIYRDVDDLFEEDKEDEGETQVGIESSAPTVHLCDLAHIIIVGCQQYHTNCRQVRTRGEKHWNTFF